MGLQKKLAGLAVHQHHLSPIVLDYGASVQFTEHELPS